MQIEHEIKALDVDAAKLAARLSELGFASRPPQAFRRYVYDATPDGAWLRLRTDGSKTTLAYKHAVADSIDGVRELEVGVEDFEKTHELLTTLGYAARAYQENRRRTYVLDDVEVSIDEWPLIPTYAEIEGPDVETVEKYLKLLGLESSETTSKPTSAVYARYGLDIDARPRLAFDQSS